MDFGYTIPLQKATRTNPPHPEACPRFFCWDLHGITLRGLPALLAVNCANRCAFVLLGFQARAWEDVAAAVMRGIASTLRQEGCSSAQIERYFAAAGEPRCTRTHGRREVAFLNRAWESALRRDTLVDLDTCFQALLTAVLNDERCRCAGHEGLGTPRARLLQDVAALARR
ncbi:MAG: hypothetical protein PHD32_00750 [Eubacteriales bacterium]|nr:hypothetical protein [Eubacteriales bacterium]